MRGRRWVVVAGERAVVAVERDGGGDRGVGPFEARLERRIVRRERGGRGEVTARRAAGEEHDVRVGAVPGAVFAHPGDDLLDVDQVVGERRGRVQPIVGADAHPTLTGEPVDERPRLAVLAAAAERAAMQVDERRAVGRSRSMAIDVEQVPCARVAVADVRDPFDVTTKDRNRPDEDAAPRGATAAESAERRRRRWRRANRLRARRPWPVRSPGRRPAPAGRRSPARRL